MEKTMKATDEHAKDARCLSNALNAISKEMEKVTPYETVNSSEPPVRRKPVMSKPKVDNQRNRTVVHTLVRKNEDGSRPTPTN